MTKHLEIKTIEHEGIKVHIKVNYDTGMVSLVDVFSHDDIQAPPKKYIFANRGMEYMNGWLIILEAITVAVKECKKDLEADLAEKSKFKEEVIIAATKKLNKK